MKALFASLFLFPSLSFGAISLTSGLLAHFELDGNVQDSSGSGLHATLSGAYTVVPDHAGNAAGGRSGGRRVLERAALSADGPFEHWHSRGVRAACRRPELLRTSRRRDDGREIPAPSVT